MPFIWMITTQMVNCVTTPVDDDERVFLENWYLGVVDIVDDDDEKFSDHRESVFGRRSAGCDRISPKPPTFQRQTSKIPFS